MQTKNITFCVLAHIIELSKGSSLYTLIMTIISAQVHKTVISVPNHIQYHKFFCDVCWFFFYFLAKCNCSFHLIWGHLRSLLSVYTKYAWKSTLCHSKNATSPFFFILPIPLNDPSLLYSSILIFSLYQAFMLEFRYCEVTEYYTTYH
jgi:hypothetical protein